MRLKDDDECRANTHECDPHATCANDVVGSYSCYCRSGYIDEVGDGRTCTDIDECETGDYAECPDDKICFNTPGSYACVLDTEPPSQSPSTPYPSGTPTGEFDKCNQILTSPAGNWCGIDGTPFGCSCDNTCAATDNCCWDYRNACAPFVDNTAVAVFQTSTVDVKFVAGGGNERNAYHEEDDLIPDENSEVIAGEAISKCVQLNHRMYDTPPKQVLFSVHDYYDLDISESILMDSTSILVIDLNLANDSDILNSSSITENLDLM